GVRTEGTPVKNSGILLVQCPDRKGLDATIAEFIYRYDGNILHFEQHQAGEERYYLARVEWDLDGFRLDLKDLPGAFGPLAKKFGMNWRIALGSNRPHAQRHADFYGIPYYMFPVTRETKPQVEEQERELLEAQQIDLLVLARYMQVLSPEFIAHYPQRIINIHHSFLPAFVGGRPHHQAYERGVKLIGATAHYVTEVLDDGPIIEQGVTRISHRDGLEDLVEKGRDLEKVVLSRAVRWHIENRILLYNNKTVIFE